MQLRRSNDWAVTKGCFTRSLRSFCKRPQASGQHARGLGTRRQRCNGTHRAYVEGRAGFRASHNACELEDAARNGDLACAARIQILLERDIENIVNAMRGVVAPTPTALRSLRAPGLQASPRVVVELRPSDEMLRVLRECAHIGCRHIEKVPRTRCCVGHPAPGNAGGLDQGH